MRLIILASDSPVSTYFAHELSRVRMVHAIVCPTKGRRNSGRKCWRRLISSVPRLGKVVRGRCASWRHKRLAHEISQQLFGQSEWPELQATHHIPYQAINGVDSGQTLRSLDPDWLLVCGAPILSERILSIPRVGTVNVHFGIAPEYRGQDSLFWTLYRRDYEKIGFTLHEVDAGIDTGPILARGFPALSTSETEATLWAKCARMAVGIADDLLNQATHQPLTKLVSSSHFCLRRSRDRTMRKELHFWWRQRQIHGRIPARPARVERFYSGQPDSPIYNPS